MHTYSINKKKCTYCGGCAALCPVSAITVEDAQVFIEENCIFCSRCFDFCPISAIDEKEKK